MKKKKYKKRLVKLRHLISIRAQLWRRKLPVSGKNTAADAYENAVMLLDMIFGKL